MFKFSLQRILELKARREEAAAQELARIRTAADLAVQACQLLEATREEGARQPAGATRTVGEMRNAGYVIQRLDERIQHARIEARQAEEKVKLSLVDFTAASQERRVLDRLRERHLGVWQHEQVQDDRRTMDNIALSRFTSPSANPELDK